MLQPALRLVGRLPRPVRKALRAAIGGGAHRANWTQALWAWHYARGEKRLDRVAEGLAPLLAREVASLEGRAVLEFGSGHLLSEALVPWLAGAAEVTACDYNPILNWRFARAAVANADRPALVEALRPLADPARLAERLGQLEALPAWTPDALARIGLRYRAPLDWSGPAPLGAMFDLIHSTSVLEHLPPAAVAPILANLHDALRPGGLMLHRIHLEDHLDFAGHPFAFLGAGTDWREADADSRGNRLRASDWLAALARLPGAEVRAVERRERTAAALPRPLHPAFAARDEADLRTAWITVAVRRS